VSTWEEITADWSKTGHVRVSNTKAHSHNDCRRGTASSIKYFVCVCLYSCNFPELYYIVICGLSGSTTFVALSQKRHSFWKTLLNIQNVL